MKSGATRHSNCCNYLEKTDGVVFFACGFRQLASVVFAPAFVCFLVGLSALSGFVEFATAQTMRSLPGKDSVGLLDTTNNAPVISFAHIQRITPLNQLSPDVIAEYIPTNIESGASGDHVFRKILDRSLRTIFNGEQFKRSNLVRTAKMIGEKVETDISFSTQSENGRQAIKHSLKMQMRAFQSMAILHYSGLFNANFSYDIGNQAGEFKVIQNLTELSDVSLSLKRDDGISTSVVSYHLNY